MTPMPRPDDPRFRAELALCRLLWLAIPIDQRRRHWAAAARQVGLLPGVWWTEPRAWELAGILRHRLRLSILDDAHAEAILDRIGHLLDADPLQDEQEAPGATTRVEVVPMVVPEASAAPRAREAV